MGATLVINQELTIGQLIAFNMLMGMVMAPLMGMVGLWEQLQRAGVAMERLGDVLDIEPEQKPEELASRIVLPDLKATSGSRICTSATAAARRLRAGEHQPGDQGG